MSSKGQGRQAGKKQAAEKQGARAMPAGLKALAEAGIIPDQNGRNWRREMKGVVSEGEKPIEAKILVGKLTNPPMINPQKEEDAATVIAWFEASVPRQGTLDEIAKTIKEYTQKGGLAFPEEMDKNTLAADFRRLFHKGVEWLRLEEELKSVYQQWEGQAKLKNQARQLEHSLSLSSYPNLYPLARSLKRKVSLFIGPTNSGKTYAAMERLAAVESGAYLAPLRLLALEGQEALLSREVPCHLITGEERKWVEGAQFVASTVEMANFSSVIDCAVIDEGQMLGDKDRGWAWTAAICAIPAKELIIVAAPEALSLLQTYLTRLGEEVEVKTFQRKNKLEVMKNPVRLSEVETGDAVIAFSRKNALMLRQQLMNQKKSVAVIYGALSPEVRRAEAERFSKGDADVLVATDAIGMGLNLPIKRVIFSQVVKFDGVEERLLTTQEMRQIAGRAGRFGMAEKGETAAMDSFGNGVLRQALEGPSEEISGKLSIAPSDAQVLQMRDALGIYLLTPLLTFFKDHLVKTDPLFKASEMDDMLELATRADRREDLSMEERFTYARTPIDRRDNEHMQVWESWLKQHERAQMIKMPVFDNPPAHMMIEDRLWEYERSMKLLCAYCWLSWRYEDLYVDREKADDQRRELSEKIETLLAKRSVKQVEALSAGHKPKPNMMKGNKGAKRFNR